MNAPLAHKVRKALESVTLDDKPRSGLIDNDTVGGAAGHRGFGAERLNLGDAP
ncbi:hypothetical protein GCM10010975_07300 [Comamonas phosphati]|nr:hypothetical protein GCM10010975_07300 [Comamonas phosphati]